MCKSLLDFILRRKHVSDVRIGSFEERQEALKEPPPEKEEPDEEENEFYSDKP